VVYFRMVDPANLYRLVHFFDILAALVFAVSGALVASRKGMDLMGFTGSPSLPASAAARCGTWC
jgi:uncharacterized membrane protein YeiH